MIHYYNVILSYGPLLVVLVKATNVIEAGQKVTDYFISNGFSANDFAITRIERTDVDKVLD